MGNRYRFFTLAGLLSALLFITLFLTTNIALADSSPTCPSVYGVACPTGALFVDKKVQHLKTGEFLDTLSSADVTFPPSQEVNFKIEVKNTGGSALSSIQLQDKLPEEINFLSVTSSGSFDSKNRTINWTIDNLNPGESRFFQIKGQIKPQNTLPAVGNLCVSNFAEAKKDNQVASDTAVLCIQTQIAKAAPVSELPKTGPKEAAYLLLALLPLGLVLKRLVQSPSLQKLENLKNPVHIWQKREFFKERSRLH